jgi:hypothetical protein
LSACGRCDCGVGVIGDRPSERDLDAAGGSGRSVPERGGGRSQRGIFGRRLDPLKEWMLLGASAMRRSRTAIRSTQCLSLVLFDVYRGQV